MKSIRQVASIACLVIATCAQSAAMAALPNIPKPSGGGIGGAAVQDGDWLALMGAYFKAGFAILGIVLGTYAFFTVMSGALKKWKEYSEGRAQLADLKEHMIVGTVLLVFIVMLANYAIQTMA
ncbi:DUF2976 domain-containing protein [Paracidovorax oryzae]|uniref:DUF2976 domain-containing protein n=1 Tax=Paracidovorax oryzae TaxID=862720 RepID=UPI00035D51FA|nr:DUF2976 domain-containing protein [Paracidovorax oryzae]